MNYLEAVREFHEKNGHPIHPGRGTPLVGGLGDNEQIKMLRARLLVEETAEAVIAIHQDDIVGLADALADLLYVTFGAALAFGVPIEAVFAEVHASNMSKDPLNEHGKGGKGPNYRPPNLTGLLWE